MGSRIDGSKGCLSGYIWWGGLFETLLDGVLKPCNSHLGGPSKSERHSCRWFGRAESSSWAGVFFLSHFFFFFFLFSSFFLLGIAKEKEKVGHHTRNGAEEEEGVVRGQSMRTGQI